MLKVILALLATGLLLVSGGVVDGFAQRQEREFKAIHPTTMVGEGDEHALLPIIPIQGLDPAIVELGRRLFNNPRLSHDGTISCASCHDLARGGEDHQRFALGIGGAMGSINAPSIYNAAFNFRQFWNGRAASLEEQVTGPITNPNEMGSTWDDVIRELKSDRTYIEDFSILYPKGISPASVSSAISIFERSLTTPDSRFDRFLKGDHSAMTAGEKEGYRLFVVLGCSSCHQGMNIGGNLFERFGIIEDYFKDRSAQNEADLGRYAVTHRERDRHVFKVPSLRNVALTAPYFHDGSAKTLDQAVSIMARYELGATLTDVQVNVLVQFLTTLTGAALVQRP